MALFPENEIEILHEYVSDDLHGLMAGIRQGLDAAAIQVGGTVTNPNAGLVMQIRAQRSAARGFLGHPSFDVSIR